jgi:hypothetical protein
MELSMAFKKFYKQPPKRIFQRPKVILTPDAIELTNKLLPVVNYFLDRSEFPRLRYSKDRAKELDKTIKLYGLQKVKDVISWIGKHHKWKYCPLILSPNHFKDKFPRIEQAMQRWYFDNPNPKISKWVIEKCEYPFFVCKGTGEPDKFAEQFPIALQLTLNNYKQFYKWVWKHKTFRSYKYLLPTPEEFTEDWWMDLYRKMDIPNMNVYNLVFRVDRPMTMRWLRNWGTHHQLITVDVTHLIKEAQKQLLPVHQSVA